MTLKGKHFSEEARKHMSEARLKGISEGRIKQPWNKGKKGVMPTPWNKGRTDVYSEETLKRISQSLTGRTNGPHTEETKRKISLAHKGVSRPYMFGHPVSEETKNKIRLSNLGRKMTTEQIEKHRQTMIGKKLGPCSEERKRKISIANSGDKNASRRPEVREKMRQAQLGKKHSQEQIAKQRKVMIDYIQNKHGKMATIIGKNEKEIIDVVESKLGYKLERQFHIIGYFIDAYCKELNLAVEVDEKRHYENRIILERDVIRQENIIKALSCKFIRIKEQEYLNDKEVINQILREVYGN